MDNIQRERLDNLKRVIELMEENSQLYFNSLLIQMQQIKALREALEAIISAKFSDNWHKKTAAPRRAAV